MAKTSASPRKRASETAKKTSVKTKSSSSTLSIDKVNEVALSTLKKLNLEEKLCNDIEWCLGSFRHDQNPTGLIETAGRALVVLKSAKAKSTKAVAASVISNLEKALKK